MFNPIEPPELILALGRVLRQAADADGRGDEYRRGQLLSGYSLARHLAAEQAAAPELEAWAREQLAELLGHEVAGDLGTALTRVFAELDDDALRARLHAFLAELTDREVAALAAAEA